MRSVPPHQRAEKAIHDVLQQGITAETSSDRFEGGSVTSLLMRLGLQALLDRALEEERTDFVGRERYARTGAPAEEPPAQGYRNGYKPGHVDTAEGRVDVAIPQVRQSTEPFQPQTLAAVRGRSAELERLVVELKDKLDEFAVAPVPAAVAGPAVEDVLSALVNLGYQRPAAEKAIEQAIAKEKALAGDFDGLFRGALKVIR